MPDFGLVALGALVGVVAALAATGGRALPATALAAGAAGVVLVGVEDQPGYAVAGVVLIVAAAAVPTLVVGASIGASGAGVLALHLWDVGGADAAVSLLLFAPVLAGAGWRADRDVGHRHAVFGLGVAVAGMYLAVPDTEGPTLVGAALAVAFLAVSADHHPAAASVAAVAAGWAGLVGTIERPASVVAVLGCMGVLLWLPLLRWPVPTGWPPLALAAVHLASAVTTARWPGLEPDRTTAIAQAAVVAASTGAATAGVLVVAGRRKGRPAAPE